MDMLPYVDSLIKEYFLFRGFSQSFYAFETECESDKSKVFNVEEAVELLDSAVDNYQSIRVVSLVQFLESNIFSKLEPELQRGFKKLTASVYKKYIVHAIQHKRIDKVNEFFERTASRLRRQPDEWNVWFSIQYVKNPEQRPEFELYFTQEWSDNLKISLQNLLSTAFHKVPLPSILRFHLDRLYRRNLQLKVQALEVEKTRLETLLSLQNGESYVLPATPLDNGNSNSNKEENSSSKEAQKEIQREVHKEVQNGNDDENDDDEVDESENSTRSIDVQMLGLDVDLADLETADLKPASALSKTVSSLSSDDSTQQIAAESKQSRAAGLEAALVSDFEGHEAPITCCRYSPDGENVASSSSDGTIRIWSAEEDATPSNRNVTIRTACNVLCLDWEPRREKLVLFGTALGTVKGWNVDSKRFVFDVVVHKEFTDIISVKCSPSDTLFAVVASSADRGEARQGNLSLWNSRTFSRIGYLSMARDEVLDSPVNCVAFSPNGQVVAAGSEDGTVSLYNSSNRKVVAGFSACFDCPIIDIKFGTRSDMDLWTLTCSGKLYEWECSTSSQKLVREIDMCTFLFEPGVAGEASGEGDSVVGNGNEIALNTSGDLLASTLGKVGVILKLGPEPGDTACEIELDSPASLDWHPSFDRLVIGSSRSKIHIYSAVQSE